MTRVLVTNDDGIDAPGLHALARTLRGRGLEIVIAAPAAQSSGSSASIMADEKSGRITIERRTLPGLDDVPTFAVHGGPGLIALLAAHGAFGERTDVVASGVNHGANVGRAILHSGTVGAALTGGLNGAWGMAVSLDVGLSPSSFLWDEASDAAADLLPVLIQHPRGTVINVNVPNLTPVRGSIEAKLAPFGIVQTTLTERDEHTVRLAVEDLPHTPEPGTDAAYLAEGWITVSGIDPVSHVRLGLLDSAERGSSISDRLNLHDPA
ncbi:5'-nucleotidase [Microbacterium sp. CH12i]|uniref:5'/3'-nucleotidase SurE n=1 Tax=Microbacterium sp. CH12i TaxID=1479651 RepID=UPI0004611C0F|nr:5'/3'-nucleotidase SurE [Microbacterium sp. CH12i]KDA05956.1 5'-nucleotidase [Microbacterium sp. CH12i]